LKPEELKNRLLWKTKIPLENASFLTNAAKLQLDNTRKAANGQFLAVSETTGQYYIDPKRVVDYDQDVATAAATINKQVVQRYLNEIVTRAIELDNEQPVLENRLWNYDLLWKQHNVERPGWLFFGFPNQRSTAKPPRDFYIFLIPSERITGLTEQFTSVNDEIYITFEHFPPAKCDEKSKVLESEKDSFLDMLRKYAAAREKESACRPGDERSAFKNIAERHLKALAPTFVENAGEWLSVIWNGQRKTFGTWVLELDPSKAQAQFRTKLDSIAEIMFSQHFQAKYPDYPTFSIKVQERTRKQNASSAIEIICKEGITTTQGKAVLTALELYKDEAPTPDQSPWLDVIRQKLVQIGAGKNLNHSDLFERRDGKDWWLGQNIEAEWLHVVLAAGVAAGDLIVIGPQNRKKYDASTLREFYSDVRTFTDIINVARPVGIPLDEWRKLFQAFGLKIGVLANVNTYDDAIRDFQSAVARRVNDLVAQEQEFKTPLPYIRKDIQDELAAKLPVFGELKATLETSLIPINTKARMPNLKLNLAEIETLSKRLSSCSALAALLTFTKANTSSLSAIQRLETVLAGSSAGFAAKRASLQDNLNDVYSEPPSLPSASVALTASIQSALEAALKAYHDLHKRYRLDMAGDRKKGSIARSAALKQLNKLTHIDVLSPNKLEEWRKVFNALVFCGGCGDAELVNDPLTLCPHCRFDPRTLPQENTPAADLIENCETELEKLHKEWTEKIIQEISDPSVVSTLSALKASEFEEISKLIGNRKLPDEVTDTFLQAVNTALKGIKRKNLTAAAFASQVLGDGTPLKPEELRQKFDTWIKSQIGDDDPNTVRFMLEK
jgi:glutaredoxin